MAAFETMVRFLESLDVFTYLAYLLLVIVLYYFFEYVLRNVKMLKERDTHRMVLAAVLSIAITALMYILFYQFAGVFGMFLGGILFVIMVIFVLAAAGFKLGGIDIPSLFRK